MHSTNTFVLCGQNALHVYESNEASVTMQQTVQASMLAQAEV